MKIAIYTPSWPPGFAANGIVTYASYLVTALRRLGHEVFVLSHLVDQANPYTIDLNKVAATPGLLTRAMFKLAPATALFKTASTTICDAIGDLVAKQGIDVFEIEESFGWSLAVSRLRLLPVVVRLHGPWFLNGRFDHPDENSAGHLRRQERERDGIEDAQYVTSPSREVLRAVQSHYGLKLSASRVIRNPIDAAVESDRWNFDACDKDMLLFVGRFDLRKGGDLVLRAFADLAELNPALRLTFVGPDEGIRNEDGQVWSFDRFVQEEFPPWFRSRVDFRGQMSHGEVTSIRTRCFATVVASRYEIAPYSVLEAMSLGCPIVATAAGGIPELIKNRHNGVLVPCQDVKAMTAALGGLLGDHARASQLGRQAWLDCRDLYGPEVIAQQTISAYQLAIDNFKHL